MKLGFLKDQLAKAQEKLSPALANAKDKLSPALANAKDKLNPMLSKVAEVTSNAMSDIGLTAANPDRAPKPIRTIDEENLKDDIAHGLLLDYAKTDSDYYISVLNKIAKECHKLHNLGIYADVVSITPSHALKFETKDNFVHCECYNAESPGDDYENDGTSENPFQHPLDELLDNGEEEEDEEEEEEEEEEERDEEEEEEEKDEDENSSDKTKEEEEEEIDDDDRPEVKARDA